MMHLVNGQCISLLNHVPVITSQLNDRHSKLYFILLPSLLKIIFALLSCCQHSYPAASSYHLIFSFSSSFLFFLPLLFSQFHRLVKIDDYLKQRARRRMNDEGATVHRDVNISRETLSHDGREKEGKKGAVTIMVIYECEQ